MSRELISLVDALASEKNVGKDVVYDALENALAAATKKALLTQTPKTDDGANDDFNIKVQIDRETGSYVTYRRWIIVNDEEYTYPSVEKTIEQIQEEKPGTELQVGDYDEEVIEGVEFCRIGAQTAKQFIMQRIRDAERRQLIDEFLARGETLVRGTVKRIEPKKHIVVEMGKLEAIIPWSQLIPKTPMHPGDDYHINDPIKAELLRVEEQGTRPVMKLTRISNEFMIRLFETEVRELRDNIVSIVAVARDPGYRAKIAVTTRDDYRVEAQGSFIGPKGSRVKAVSSELKGEKIDVIQWSPDDADFIVNALAPSKVLSIILDEERRRAEVIVEPGELAKAIGRNGQNVRLANELTGWDLDILTAEEAKSLHDEEESKLVDYFMEVLGVDKEIAATLVSNGFKEVGEIASLDEEDCDDVEGIDREVLDELCRKALNWEVSETERKRAIIAAIEPSVKELFVDDEETLLKLHREGVRTLDDLAGLSGDELVEATGIEKSLADQIILISREHWFEEEKDGGAHE